MKPISFHRASRLALLALAVIVPAQSASACEPVFPLIQVFTGILSITLFEGLAFLLPLAIGIKCLAFAWFEKQLNWRECVGYMFAANIYSSVLGVLASGSAAIPVLFVTVPVIYLASRSAAGRILRYVNWGGPRTRMSRTTLAFLFTLTFLLTVFLFEAARGPLGKRDYAHYWLWKLAYVTVALSLSIILTSSWEESVIARLAASKHPDSNYLVSVGRANYITFGVLLLIAALIILPTRLRTEGFLFKAWFKPVPGAAPILGGG